MDRSQFVVLYREFLFRMVDRDLLSPDAGGDSGQLLGRFAAILIWLSIGFTTMALGIPGHGSRDAILIAAFPLEHTLIATTMLIVALFAVLSWDSILPDRRDVLVLHALPVRGLTLVMAKVAALAAGLAIAVAVFNAIPGIAVPFALTSAGSNLLEMLFSVQTYRTFLAYWTTLVLAGGFVLAGVVCLQSLASQLPRALFLRVSSVLQIGTFCLAVGTYFLQPSLAAPARLAAAGKLPSYWFLALLQQLNGLSSDATLRATLNQLAGRAWMGLALAGGLAAAGFLLSSYRTLRRIGEEPDLVPVRQPGRTWLRFGSPLDTAVVHFSIRTIVRSRQHRVLIAFYAGLGFAILILFLQTPFARNLASSASLASSFVMLICWILGVRVAFAMPLELRANWIFKLTLTQPAERSIRASREALYVIGILPCLAVAAAAFLWYWPVVPAAKHLLVLAMLGLTLAMLCLGSYNKIPFTCSYLPGRTNLHIALALSLMLGLNVTFWAAAFERQALFDGRTYVLLLTGLSLFALLAWLRLRFYPDEELRFDEEQSHDVAGLGLNRDGVFPDAISCD